MSVFPRIALALLLFAVCPLSAATINVLSVDRSRFQAVNLNVDGRTGNHQAGVIRISYNASPAFDVFCVDLFTSISYGLYDTNLIAPRSARFEDRAAWLYANYYTPTLINTPVLGAAFQVAIWDIIHDGGDGPNSGRIRSSSNTGAAVVNAWNSHLSNSFGRSDFGVRIFLNARQGQPAQALMGFVPLSETPEPASVLLIATGFLAFALRRAR